MSIPTLIFHQQFDVDAAEIQLKGWYGAGTVLVPDGRRYEVTFMHPDRIATELAFVAANGRPLIAEPGLLVVPDVSRSSMEHAVQLAWEEGYFDSLVPLK